MNDNLFKQTHDMFNAESETLEEIIDDSIKKINILEITEIVQIYYRIINISSIIKVIKSQCNEKKKEQLELVKKTKETEIIIKKKFDETLHQGITKQLSEKIKNLTNDLKENNQKKTREEIKNDAKSFEKLREIMSTREFVEQYDKELKK